MSKIALSGNPSGTATYTIASPAGSTDRTLTLPDNSGTLLSNASTAGFPAGSVLQVVRGATSAEVSTSSTSYADTGLSVSITPSSASSKILVFVFQAVETTSDNEFRLKILRNSTEVKVNTRAMSSQFAGITACYASISLIDTPSTTSEITYKTTFSSRDTGEVVHVQRSNAAESTITLMEIAA